MPVKHFFACYFFHIQHTINVPVALNFKAKIFVVSVSLSAHPSQAFVAVVNVTHLLVVFKILREMRGKCSEDHIPSRQIKTRYAKTILVYFELLSAGLEKVV